MLFIMIFMFFVNVKLSLVVLSGLPIFAVIMMMIKKRQRKAWQDVSNKSSNLNAYLQENITGARVTQIFTREEENAQIFDRLSEKYRKSWINAVKYSNLVWPATDNVSTPCESRNIRGGSAGSDPCGSEPWNYRCHDKLCFKLLAAYHEPVKHLQ